MSRKWRQKNPQRRHAKRPDRIYAEILRHYCAGRTQTETAEVVSRWASDRKLPPVSRQTANRHFQEAALRLWYHWFKTLFGAEPGWLDNPQDCLASTRSFIDGSSDAFHRTRFSYRWNRTFWDKELPGETPDTINADFTLLRLRGIWNRMNGIPRESFFVQWYRVLWLDHLRRLHPQERQAELQQRLLGILMCEAPTYRPPELRARVTSSDDLFRVLGRYFGQPEPWMSMICLTGKDFSRYVDHCFCEEAAVYDRSDEDCSCNFRNASDDIDYVLLTKEQFLSIVATNHPAATELERRGVRFLYFVIGDIEERQQEFHWRDGNGKGRRHKERIEHDSNGYHFVSLRKRKFNHLRFSQRFSPDAERSIVYTGEDRFQPKYERLANELFFRKFRPSMLNWPEAAFKEDKWWDWTYDLDF